MRGDAEVRRESGWALEAAIGERWRERRKTDDDGDSGECEEEQAGRGGGKTNPKARPLDSIPCLVRQVCFCGSEENESTAHFQLILLTGGNGIVPYFA